MVLPLLGLLALLTFAIPQARAESQAEEVLPPYLPADASAPAVTDANLLDNDRFWPYQIALTRAWQPAGEKSLPAGSLGVLIRVDASGSARIDFGRDGFYQVPIAETDVVARANRIRLGELAKDAPNFLYSIGPRLADSASAEPRPFPYREAAERRLFLSVFADPGAEGFRALSRSLIPLRERAGMLTILFPQGRHPDVKVREQLRKLGWPVPFVYDHLSEPYTSSLIGEEGELPALALQSADGRLLFESRWRAGVGADLVAAVEAALGPAPTARD